MKKKSLIPKYVHQGKIFDNEKDFHEYVKAWPYKNLKFEDVERLLNVLKKELQRDLYLNHRKIKCGVFQEIIDKAYYFIMQEVNKVSKIEYDEHPFWEENVRLRVENFQEIPKKI